MGMHDVISWGLGLHADPLWTAFAFMVMFICGMLFHAGMHAIKYRDSDTCGLHGRGRAQTRRGLGWFLPRRKRDQK